MPTDKWIFLSNALGSVIEKWHIPGNFMSKLLSIDNCLGGQGKIDSQDVRRPGNFLCANARGVSGGMVKAKIERNITLWLEFRF